MENRLMPGEHSRSPGVRLKGGQACKVSESGRESGRNEPAHNSTCNHIAVDGGKKPLRESSHWDPNGRE